MSTKNAGTSHDFSGIHARLAEIRTSRFGPRSQARFAKELGISPTTYCNYEKDRTPPAPLLVAAADLCGCDLMWLLTGRNRSSYQAPAVVNPQHRAILARAAKLLAGSPASAPALAAFLDLLDAKAKLETRLDPQPAAPPPANVGFNRWVPIFGWAAAGLARFWRELNEQAPAAGPTALDRMIHEAAQSTDARTHLAVLEMSGRDGNSRRRRARADVAGEVSVRLVQLSSPITDYQLTEFLDIGADAIRYRPLFGLRLDGDSMEPMFADGTIVLCCPSEPARAGKPAVVRLAGQIGLTCKIYRPNGPLVRLVAANSAYETQEFPTAQLEWALAVLGSVKLS